MVSESQGRNASEPIRSGNIRCVPGGAKASAGTGGVANGYRIGWVCLATTARCLRCGGGWKRVHGSATEALPEETGRNGYAGPSDYRASPRPDRPGSTDPLLQNSEFTPSAEGPHRAAFEAVAKHRSEFANSAPRWYKSGLGDDRRGGCPGEFDGDYGDVVQLAEVAGGFGDLCCGFAAD